MVLLEAKSHGLPIVSFDCLTGPREIVRDGVDGLLVPERDTQALADAVCALIEDPARRASMAANARGNLDEFSKEKIMRQWRELIDGLE